MNAEVELAYVSFTISGDNVAPGFWTGYFGVQPDIAVTKGAPIRGAGGTGTAQRRTGVWGLESRLAVRSDQLGPHLQFLQKRLGLPRADLRALVEQVGARMRFFCYWVNESGNRVPVIPHDIQTMAEDQGIAIDIDEYR